MTTSSAKGCRARRLFCRAARIGGTLCLPYVLASTSLQARPIACGDAGNGERAEAARAADERIKPFWVQLVDRSAVAYRLKPEPVEAPLLPMKPPSNGGVASGGVTPFPLSGPKAQQLAPGIEGVLVVDRLECSIYEIGPPRAFVVLYRAGGLTFKEGDGAWSPKLPHGLVHALAVRRVEGRWVVSPMPGARTSLPEDATFSRPAAPIEPPGTRKAKGR